MGWSPDGNEWEWQTMADAFGSRGGWAWAELAVGRDFVLARVMGSDLPPDITEVVHPQVGSLTRSLATDTQPERWFIASVPQRTRLQRHRAGPTSSRLSHGCYCSPG